LKVSVSAAAPTVYVMEIAAWELSMIVEVLQSSLISTSKAYGAEGRLVTASVATRVKETEPR